MVMHVALAKAVRWDWIWSNPASHTMCFAEGPRSHEVPLVDVIQTALDSLRTSDPLMMLFVRLAATTGARGGRADTRCVSITAAHFQGADEMVAESSWRRTYSTRTAGVLCGRGADAS